MKAARADAATIVKDVSGDRNYNDVNYVFPTFVLTQLPIGLVGVLIAAIMVAAMTASSAELAALSTATVIDFYRRWVAPNASDRQLLVASRVAVGAWGLFASVVAVYASELGSLIEVVNRFGSYFYGSILGVFVLAIAFPRTNGQGAFVGLFGGMAAVTYVATQTTVEFLWLNLVGVVAVCLVGVPVSAMTGGRRSRRRGVTRPPVANRPLFIALGIVALVMRRLVGARRGPPPAQDDEAAAEALSRCGRAYSSTCTPSSTTRSGGKRKKPVGRTALRAIITNRCSRQVAMPGAAVAMSVSRPRK